jgi:SAM-dependent methyltransferase
MSSVATERRGRCAICGSRTLDLVADLPGLPLTGFFVPAPPKERPVGVDQRLLMCGECGHGQLEQIIAPSILYGDDYGFRTESGERSPSDELIAILDEIAPGKRFGCVLDIGCNDLYLLKQLRGRADALVGIDPIWEGKEHENTEPDIQAVGGNVAAIDLAARIAPRPDLIVCSHTLEHIQDPLGVLRQLMEFAEDGALFLFQSPSLDDMVRETRFDLVFHEHVQYFSCASFLTLIDAVGGRYVMHRESHRHKATLSVAFSKSTETSTAQANIPHYSSRDAVLAFQEFIRQVAMTRDALNSQRAGRAYGYGAAGALETLAYHMDDDFSALAAILDDAPGKRGLYYPTLTPQIVASEDVSDIGESVVMITAVDSGPQIMKRLSAEAPRQIIYPFHLR